ncbi:hypothetical protein LTR86_004189 [Recurvomyces mirabilis]|nr:hypothetical protein LTR86_004189 [Recurvomyces mirabilis]
MTDPNFPHGFSFGFNQRQAQNAPVDYTDSPPFDQQLQMLYTMLPDQTQQAIAPMQAIPSNQQPQIQQSFTQSDVCWATSSQELMQLVYIQPQVQYMPLQYHPPAMYAASTQSPPVASAPVPQNYDHLKISPSPVPTTASANPQSVTTTTTTTTQQQTAYGSSLPYQQAAAQDPVALQQYQSRVQQILRMSDQTCPARLRWYQVPGGWLCGGGSHFVLQSDVDDIIQGSSHASMPKIILVNCIMIDGFDRVHEVCAAAHPPNEAFHEGMHEAHRGYMESLAQDDHLMVSRQGLDLEVTDSRRLVRPTARPSYGGAGI